MQEAQPWILRDGPERIESGWWDGADVRRDYFVAVSPRGETAWIARWNGAGTLQALLSGNGTGTRIAEGVAHD